MFRVLVRCVKIVVRAICKHPALYLCLLLCVLFLLASDQRKREMPVSLEVRFDKATPGGGGSDDDSQPLILPPLEPDTLISQPSSNRPVLLTMFTSFKNSTKRNVIEINTIKNWASFKPMVQPVMFADSLEGELADIAKSHGWKVHKVPRTNQAGTPLLKNMYMEVYKNYDSNFVGFCNGDILFDDSLVTTLKGLVKYLDYLNSTMVIGRRRNYWMKKNLTQPEFLYKKEVVKFVSHYSSMFSPDAEDYFFLSYHGFLWSKLKDVVIGRPGYDNYFVAMARKCNMSVVDATKTILALHQTGNEGKFAGAHNKDSHYNKHLIGSFNYGKGTTPFGLYETHKDARNDIFITKRKLSKKKNIDVPVDIDRSILAQEISGSKHGKQSGKNGSSHSVKPSKPPGKHT